MVECVFACLLLLLTPEDTRVRLIRDSEWTLIQNSQLMWLSMQWTDIQMKPKGPQGNGCRDGGMGEMMY